ncbi:MAG: heme A synthase [Gammaproteobacteria bacterium]|jgi:cytochrome c oxidase assembly protein subunit 15|nr:heme A synthase [Gammaproteobacteria bacterium]
MVAIVRNNRGALRLPALLLTLLALGVVTLGAYVRLSDAGLACPDWPGCYGQLTVPQADSLAADDPLLQQRPLEPAKAWKEMLHRYLAAGLGLGIVLMAGYAWRMRGLAQSLLPLLLVVLVVFQGLLGMWTVTLLVKPAVVTLHLLGGLATTALLWWFALREGGDRGYHPAPDWLRTWAWLALGVLLLQIALGGWTSTNYAALSCPEFPTCLAGLYLPPADFGEAFVLWRGTGTNYEFGVLDAEARTAIHLAHRFGALAVLAVVGGLVLALMARPAMRAPGLLLGVLLAVQIVLGIANVVGGLPLLSAVAHNGNAALLVLALLVVLHRLRTAYRSTFSDRT